VREEEIAAKIVAGKRLEENLFDGVAVAIQPTKDLRMERRLPRHRHESGTRQDLITQHSPAWLPFGERSIIGRDEVCVSVREVVVALVLSACWNEKQSESKTKPEE
jgi:hypothetical protein